MRLGEHSPPVSRVIDRGDRPFQRPVPSARDGVAQLPRDIQVTRGVALIPAHHRVTPAAKYLDHSLSAGA
ncbi:MAG TPA: hypothetical protein VGD79_06700, partial [Thermoanaerobaculia bacterium]